MDVGGAVGRESCGTWTCPLCSHVKLALAESLERFILTRQVCLGWELRVLYVWLKSLKRWPGVSLLSTTIDLLLYV